MSEVMTTGRAAESPQGVVVYTTRPPVDNLSNEVLVYWQDKRGITSEQRRKAWALMTEIADYQGQTKDDVYAEQKTAFTLKHLEILQGELFRLSSATVTMARAFITMLIEIIIEYGILGLELMPLCREHHRECHDNGQTAFNSKYHLIGIPADEKICKKAGLKYAD